MSLVSGPGRGGGYLPGEMTLVVDQHVKYIQSLDTVRGRQLSQPLSGGY